MSRVPRRDLRDGERLIGRREFLTGGAVVLAGGALALAGCGSSGSATSGAGNGSATGKSAADNWNALLAAAKKEGQVNVSGPVGTSTQQILAGAFEKQFGIKVSLLTGNTSQLMTRWGDERAAGQHTMDVSVGGVDNIVEMLNYGWLQPLKPHLVAPGVTSGWKTGGPWFRDPKGDTVLQIFSTVEPNVQINAGIVPPDEIKKAQDLLNPKWKGKISSYNPGVPGPGNKVGYAFIAAKGKQFAKELYVGQSVALTRDYKQPADWLAHGEYPIALACTWQYMLPYIQSGIKLQNVRLSDVQETVGGGFGDVVMWSDSPHPNAAAVYCNWLAGAAGMAAYGKNQYQDPVRSDIQATWLPASLIPQGGAKYVDAYNFGVVSKDIDPATKYLSTILQ